MKWNICISVSLLLVLFPIYTQASGLRLPRIYYYTDEKDWKDAQSFCREKHVDLATIKNEEDNKLFDNLSGWIGLHQDIIPDSEWKWSRGDEIATFLNWNEGEPNDPLLENCAALRSTGKWSNHNCESKKKFICIDDNLVLVKENKTWEEALDYCRSLGKKDTDNPFSDFWMASYDLVTLISDEDHDYAREKAQEATTDELWTGLRFLGDAWFWVDGEAVQYPTIPICPAFGCGVLEKSRNTAFEIRACSEKRNFFCQLKS